MAFFGIFGKKKEEEKEIVNHMSEEDKKLNIFYNKELLRATAKVYFNFCNLIIDCKEELVKADKMTNFVEANFYNVDLIAVDERDKRFHLIHCLENEDGINSHAKLRDILKNLFSYSYVFPKTEKCKDYTFTYNFVIDKDMEKDEYFNDTFASLKEEGRFIKSLKLIELEIGDNIKNEHTLTEIQEFQKTYVQKYRYFANQKITLTVVGETYEFKEQIKALKFTWNKENKAWTLETTFKRFRKIKYDIFKISRDLKLELKFN